MLNVLADAAKVDITFRHPEGWLVDAFSWDVPGRTADPHSTVRARSEPGKLSLIDGAVSIAAGETWLNAWPRLHVLNTDLSAVPLPLPMVDTTRAAQATDSSISAPLAGDGWTGSITARSNGTETVFDYTATYSGERRFDAHEIGLAFDLPAGMTDLWWHRVGDWSAYPEGHIGRARGYARSAPAPANPLKPAARWEDDTTDAGTNDYRSAKRSILAAGATNGHQSVSVLSDGAQHVRASIADGAPVLHVFDWYGGVPLTMDTEHIWTAYFGTGRRIERGTILRGRVTLTYGTLPSDAGGDDRRAGGQRS